MIGQVLLSLAVLALGASLAAVDLARASGRAGRTASLLGRAGLAATSSAAIFSLLLIWTPLGKSGIAWRLWWISSALAVTAAHLVLLHRARCSGPFLLVRNLSQASALTCAAVLLGMAFRADVFRMPGPVFSPILLLSGSLAALGSLALLAAALAPAARVPGIALRTAGWTVVPLILFGGGFYLGRITSPPAGAGLHRAGLSRL